ncbi:MAG: hypothetical protein EZS28_055406, partial [Streblomastix strix]
ENIGQLDYDYYDDYGSDLDYNEFQTDQIDEEDDQEDEEDDEDEDEEDEEDEGKQDGYGYNYRGGIECGVFYDEDQDYDFG